MWIKGSFIQTWCARDNIWVTQRAFLADRTGPYLFMDRSGPQFLADLIRSGPTGPHKKFDPGPERFLDRPNPDGPGPDRFVAPTWSDRTWTRTRNFMKGPKPWFQLSLPDFFLWECRVIMALTALMIKQRLRQIYLRTYQSCNVEMLLNRKYKIY
jgi:hypothetical protein